MQTRDEVEGLHNCLEFSQPLSCLHQAFIANAENVFYCLSITIDELYNRIFQKGCRLLLRIFYIRIQQDCSSELHQKCFNQHCRNFVNRLKLTCALQQKYQTILLPFYFIKLNNSNINFILLLLSFTVESFRKGADCY